MYKYRDSNLWLPGWIAVDSICIYENPRTSGQPRAGSLGRCLYTLHFEKMLHILGMPRECLGNALGMPWESDIFLIQGTQSKWNLGKANSGSTSWSFCWERVVPNFPRSRSTSCECLRPGGPALPKSQSSCPGGRPQMFFLGSRHQNHAVSIEASRGMSSSKDFTTERNCSQMLRARTFLGKTHGDWSIHRISWHPICAVLSPSCLDDHTRWICLAIAATLSTS